MSLSDKRFPVTVQGDMGYYEKDLKKAIHQLLNPKAEMALTVRNLKSWFEFVLGKDLVQVSEEVGS